MQSEGNPSRFQESLEVLKAWPGLECGSLSAGSETSLQID